MQQKQHQMHANNAVNTFDDKVIESQANIEFKTAHQAYLNARTSLCLTKTPPLLGKFEGNTSDPKEGSNLSPFRRDRLSTQWVSFRLKLPSTSKRCFDTDTWNCKACRDRMN